MDKMTSPSKAERKQLDVQIQNLQNQLEQVTTHPQSVILIL